MKPDINVTRLTVLLIGAWALLQGLLLVAINTYPGMPAVEMGANLVFNGIYAVAGYFLILRMGWARRLVMAYGVLLCVMTINMVGVTWFMNPDYAADNWPTLISPLFVPIAFQAVIIWFLKRPDSKAICNGTMVRKIA